MAPTTPQAATKATSPESPTSTISSTAPATTRRNEVHFVIQGKGGVGKSFVATILAEYLKERIEDLRCFDTDPVNPTFTSYRAFDVKRIDLFEQGRINSKAFDAFMVSVLDKGASGVIDNGATTFIPLMNYIRQSGAFEMLIESGKTVFVHILVAGGDAAGETIDGFTQIVKHLPAGVRTIVWLNELHGPVTLGGTEFEDLSAYRDAQSRVSGIVTLPAPQSDMFARDLQDMRQKRVTFRQAIESNAFNVMERQRFAMMRRDLFERVGTVL